MPALRAFGRRWNLGSDDLVFPGITEITIRGVWFIVLQVIYLLKRDQVTCDFAEKIKIFYIGTFCLLATQIVLCVAMTVLSARGTMVDKRPRRHISLIIYLKLVCFLPEVAWAIIGTIWTFTRAGDCEDVLVKSAEGVVVVEWLFIVSTITSIIVTFDPLGRRHMRKRSLKDYNQVWQTRCRVLCCCICGDENRQGAFNEIADMLTNFFKYKDIVLSDVIAGLVLLHTRSDGEKLSNNRTTITATQTSHVINSCRQRPTDRDQKTLKDWMNLENANYYCKYAVGSYARYNYIMCRNCDERCSLCHKYKMPCQSRRFSSDTVIGDNSCECHMAAVLQYTGIHPDDILFANFANQIYETPYFVALDESRQTVIISIRGTKSFQDAVTDLTAVGESLEVDGLPAGNVHGGMLKVAKNIHQQLDEVKILDRVTEEYDLILTGHSLGAGTAVLLSLLLKSRFPNLRCFAYSPPGGLVSMNLQLFTQDFVCSVVLGNDVIPRLSLTSMEKLKYELLAAIKHSKLPKYKILTTGVLAVCCGWRDNTDLEERTKHLNVSNSTNKLFDLNDDSIRALRQKNGAGDDVTVDKRPTDNVNNVCGDFNSEDGADVTTVSSDVIVDVDRESNTSNCDLKRHREITEPKIRPTTYQEFHESHMKWKRDREKMTSVVIDPLYLPGHILHLVEEPTTMSLASAMFRPCWRRPEYFVDIVVSPNMLHHHHGYMMRQALQQTVTERPSDNTPTETTAFINNQH